VRGECAVLAAAGKNVKGRVLDFDAPDQDVYLVVSLLRALSLRKCDPARWKLLWHHMSHHKRRKESDYWKKRTERAVAAVQSVSGWDDADALKIVLGVLLVNDFEVSISRTPAEEKDFPSIRGLFALASMPSHSCVSNTRHDFAGR